MSDGAKVAQKGANAARRKEKETKEAQNGARGKADAKRERKGIKIKPKATKMIQNCSQKATIGYQMGHKRLPKVDLGARVDFLCQKGGGRTVKFWRHFGNISYQKVDQKSMQKPMSKNMTFNQKAIPKGC